MNGLEELALSKKGLENATCGIGDTAFSGWLTKWVV